MKKVFILSLLWFAFTTSLLGQSKTVEKTLAVPASNKVDLQLKFANNIKITAWDKKEASVKITYEINSGKLNDALKLEFAADNNSARVNVDLDGDLLKTGKAEDCPEGKSYGYSTDEKGQRSYTCSTINYEVFVPRNADLTVETINGDIELRGVTGPVQAKSISGFVDMSWPAQKGAAVALKTITGEVYSDLDIALHNKKENPMIGYELKGNLNGGGSKVNLESISNDIYLRKQE
ncbi:hypothetical protein [Pontibacter sp. SGAir0037]|uniref:hypothetical protein n=1 Tax=Pontibacter sp. SGAir0037 TaxID=2571030 RepID=UPI0010CCE559|nr:hypothetical protein [Pontibacter sp. SGAir0037]QCR23839.1 hypothetical protein C1N53_16785 [Pontibacter sp. SGAir0037]